MIKGAQKRMIVVKTADNRVFEEAYFVMRDNMTESDEDMVSEANRIIESLDTRRRERTKNAPSALLITILSFIGGSVLGSLATFAVMLFK